MSDEKNDACCSVVPHQQHFLANMYCWSHKKPVTLNWTLLRLEGICAESFTHRKRIT